MVVGFSPRQPSSANMESPIKKQNISPLAYAQASDLICHAYTFSRRKTRHSNHLRQAR
jgi:hypothetical protein